MVTKWKRFWTATIVAGMLALGVLSYWAWQRYNAFSATPMSSSNGVARVKRGDRVDDLIQTLRQNGIADDASALMWRLLAYQTNAAGHLKAGEYAIGPKMTPRELLEHIRQGRVIQYRFTIVEGWTLRQLREALDHAPQLNHTLSSLTDRAMMEAIQADASEPEGWFLPETYLYQAGMSDRDILRRAYRAMQTSLTRAWATRDANLPLQTPEQALTLASIIEKETGIAAERRQIAGVFIRRLQRGMRLQTDPTVIYGMGHHYTGVLHRHDLLTDSPYNTYTRSGLPPTPIALPGLQSLEAAVHPAPGDSVYFVAKGDGTGRHQFSATLSEHNRAVTNLIHLLQKNRHNDGTSAQ